VNPWSGEVDIFPLNRNYFTGGGEGTGPFPPQDEGNLPKCPSEVERRQKDEAALVHEKPKFPKGGEKGTNPGSRREKKRPRTKRVQVLQELKRRKRSAKGRAREYVGAVRRDGAATGRKKPFWRKRRNAG